ncbi:JM25 [macacine gammaherpesvirus 11]|uniref:JM25 n=2 Tax=macacine gammaherpesvirus 11 TaxID=2560570 RepID=G9JM33_9GAMA|nr:JM25 [Macaca fuscata rhadinovirus]AAT00002.1 JM25 [Macaca fuscata rhadinovirus]AEW87550.1 JM25 [Macaca fuscata rhadinovirus]AEW87720.1 JM25 [Macaca fuscata rhadinovirus]
MRRVCLGGGDFPFIAGTGPLLVLEIPFSTGSLLRRKAVYLFGESPFFRTPGATVVRHARFGTRDATSGREARAPGGWPRLVSVEADPGRGY